MEQELAARTCELPKIADTAPLEQVPGSTLVTVPVAINGTPHQFLLDIGLKRPTAVSPQLMAKLGLPEAFRMGQPTAAPGLGAYPFALRQAQGEDRGVALRIGILAPRESTPSPHPEPVEG